MIYDKEFIGKTIMITGTSKGIGKALVQYFLQSGAYVIALSRHTCGIVHENLREMILDVRERNKIEQIINEEERNVEILINNAGIMCHKSFLEIQKEDIDTVFDINFTSTVLLSQIIAKKMIRNKIKGIIVNTISFAANIPSVGSGIYAASKAALENMNRIMAAELIPYGIRVNGYSPGVIGTDMTASVIRANKESLINNIAIHEIGTCECMVEVVAFLASSRSQYLCGCNIDASGGKFIVQNTAQAWAEKEEQV